MAFEEGPYLQTACFCEMVIEDKNGVLSLIRIIDTLTHTAAGPTPPEQMQPFDYSLNLVLMLKSGRARGRHELDIFMEEPSGVSNKMGSMSVHFEGEDKGQNVITNVRIRFSMEGLYWFHVKLDGELWTSMPFRIKYSRINTGSLS